MMSSDGLDELSAALAAAGAQNILYHDCIHIPLQDDKGLMEIRAPVGSERSVQIFKDSESFELAIGPCECSAEPASCAKYLLLQLSLLGRIARKTIAPKSPLGET
jgi:hypothetical protein